MLPLNGMVVSVGMMSTITPPSLQRSPNSWVKIKSRSFTPKGVGDILSCLEYRDAVVPVGDRAGGLRAERHSDDARFAPRHMDFAAKR